LHLNRVFHKKCITFSLQASKFVFIYLDLLDLEFATKSCFMLTISEQMNSIRRYDSNLTRMINRVSLSLVQNTNYRVFQDSLLYFSTQGFIPILCLEHFNSLFLYPLEFGTQFFSQLLYLVISRKVSLVISTEKDVCLNLIGYSPNQVNYSHFLYVLELRRFTAQACLDLIKLPNSKLSNERPVLNRRFQDLALLWG